MVANAKSPLFTAKSIHSLRNVNAVATCDQRKISSLRRISRRLYLHFSLAKRGFSWLIATVKANCVLWCQGQQETGLGAGSGGVIAWERGAVYYSDWAMGLGAGIIGTVTVLWSWRSRFRFSARWDFLFSKASVLPPAPTQGPIRWVPALFPEVYQPGLNTCRHNACRAAVRAVERQRVRKWHRVRYLAVRLPDKWNTDTIPQSMQWKCGGWRQFVAIFSAVCAPFDFGGRQQCWSRRSVAVIALTVARTRELEWEGK